MDPPWSDTELNGQLRTSVKNQCRIRLPGRPGLTICHDIHMRFSMLSQSAACELLVI